MVLLSSSEQDRGTSFGSDPIGKGLQRRRKGGLLHSAFFMAVRF
jgi:hypothetical protein